jgi:transcriptional regulator with XRE-family HTH domain
MIENFLLEHAQIIAGPIRLGNRSRYSFARDTRRMPSIAARVIALRQARGMSTTDLARACGISQPSMHNIESGKTKTLRGKTLAELARVLGANPEMILGKGSFTEAQLHEAEMLSLWRALDGDQHRNILAIMQGLAGTKSARQDQAPSPKPQAPSPKPQARAARTSLE